MAKPMYLARHGEHVKNVLTQYGTEEVLAAAHHLVKQLNAGTTVHILSSELGRAIGSAAIYIAVLADAGFDIIFHGGDERLTAAQGLRAIMTGDAPLTPTYGQGFIKAWRELSSCSLPDGADDYDQVGKRASVCLLSYHDGLAEDSVLLAVFHGGTIEPAADHAMEAIIPDLPSAALVTIDDDGTFEVFDPDPELSQV